MTTTILFASGEDIGFTPIGVGSVSVQTTSSKFRSSWARCAVELAGADSTADPTPIRYQTSTFTSSSELWASIQVYLHGGNVNTNNAQSLIFRSPDGISRLLLRQATTSGEYKISKRDSAGVITDIATSWLGSAVPATSVNKFDLFINYISSGQISLYVNGILQLDFTGDPRTDAATQINRMEIGSFSHSASGGQFNDYSEIIIADGNTRSMNLLTLNPVAAGNTQSWTPNTVTNINEVTLSDSTFVSASAASSLSEWTTPTTIPSGVYDVAAIVQEARVQVGTTGPQTFEWLMRTKDGSDHVTGSVSPTNSFGNFRNTWSINPQTSVAFVTSDIATGFNLGIESTT